MASCGISQEIKEEFAALDLNNDGHIDNTEYATARQGAGGGGGGGDCEDCVQVVKNWKTVQVPCTRNTYKQYTIKVPRQVTEQVPRTVKFTKMEKRQKTVPYQVTRMENRTKFQTINMKVPVTKTVTKMHKVVKRVPKTIYVNVTSMEPRQETVTEMQNRSKQIKIPYQVPVKETKFRNVTYEEPVTMQKTVIDKVTKTVFDTQVRTRCEPKTSMVSKRIPVYNVVARPPAPCPPDMPCGQNNSGGGGGGGGMYAQEFQALDTNNDGQMSLQEYSVARQGASGGGGGGGGMQMQSASGGGGAAMAMQASASSGAAMQVSSASGGGGGAQFASSGGGGGGQFATEFKALDLNSNNQLSLQEYAAARRGASSGMQQHSTGY